MRPGSPEWLDMLAFVRALMADNREALTPRERVLLSIINDRIETVCLVAQSTGIGFIQDSHRAIDLPAAYRRDGLLGLVIPAAAHLQPGNC